MERLTTRTLLPGDFLGARGNVATRLVLLWDYFKEPVTVPLLRLSVALCLVMSLMLFVERIYMGVVIAYVKVFGKSAERSYNWIPFQDNDDVELGSAVYPTVLVQIPMYNEREVYQLSIAAACGMLWPQDRIIIQVLDDSTDPSIKQMVDLECRRWASKGIDIKYEVRSNRNGYKAGALREGMRRSYIKHCNFVAIFDADFQPRPDFLLRTVPFLVHNPSLALVQARWKFVNSDKCLLTRMQEMSLDYHFTVEQEVGSSTYAFFGFNGTAGVWRISALSEAGGWKERTTVEDMDLAVRASLRGWKFLYLGNITVKNELPSSFKAYRYQQHRWSCGPANLFRKMLVEIVQNEKVTFWTKIYVIYSFFLVRKIVAHLVTFYFYCVVLPMTALIPEVSVPTWAVLYIPIVTTLLNSISTPRSLHLMPFWILFENVMSLHRTKATIIGLFEADRANEWIVTEKFGDALKAKTVTRTPKRAVLKFYERLYLPELGVGAYLLLCATYNLAFGNNHYFLYLYIQASAFFIMGEVLIRSIGIPFSSLMAMDDADELCCGSVSGSHTRPISCSCHDFNTENPIPSSILGAFSASSIREGLHKHHISLDQ